MSPCTAINVTAIRSPPVNKSNTKAKRQKKSKLVSFHSLVTVAQIRHINEYSRKEIARCWYSPEERRATRRDMSREMKILRQVDQEFGQAAAVPVIRLQDKYCFSRRGLDCRMKEATDARVIRKERCYAAVMGEQKKQRQTGMYDPQLISDSCSKISAESAEAALERAFQDASEVQR